MVCAWCVCLCVCVCREGGPVKLVERAAQQLKEVNPFMDTHVYVATYSVYMYVYMYVHMYMYSVHIQ